MAQVDEEDRASDTEEAGYPEIPEWAFKAWQMHLSGVTNWSAIARSVGVTMSNGRPDGEKVKRYVEKLKRFRAQLRGAEDIEEATEDYLEGKTMDLRDADRLVQNADNDNAKVAALKTRTAIRDNIAAARGVTMQRKAKVVEGEFVEIATPKDVLAVVQRAINLAQGSEEEQAAGRALGSLAVVALKALETTDLAVRIEALEEATAGGARGRRC